MDKKEPRARTKDIDIWCAFDALLPLAEIKVNPRNPNIHPSSQVKMLAENIRRYGWRHPITVSTLSGLIVAGHCRYEAACLLQAEQAPVEYQNFESESEEISCLVSDNRIAELSEMDAILTGALLRDIVDSSPTVDMAILGYDDAARDALLQDVYLAESTAICLEGISFTEMDLSKAATAPIYVVLRTDAVNKEELEKMLALWQDKADIRKSYDI